MNKAIFEKVRDFLLTQLRSPFIKNVLTVGLVTLFIKFIGFYKELIIAKNFGLSELLDTFLIAMLLPGLVSNVFLGSYKSVFIPNYIRELSQKGNITAFQTSSFIITFSIGIILTLIVYLAMDTYIETLFKGHTPEYYYLVKTQLKLILPCLVLWAISSLLTGLLHIDNEFFFSSFSSMFLAISTIICILFFRDTLQEKVLAVGVLIGSILDLLYLLIITLKRKILHFGKPDFGSKNIIELFRQIPSKISSSLINGLNPVVDQYFSTQLIIGSVAALNFGLKVPAVIIGLIGVALGNVLLPYFSKIATTNYADSFINLQKLLRINLVACGLLAIVLIALSQPIVALLFERDAFTPNDTQIVYRVQQMYILQIPFYVVGIIMNRFLTAINKNNFLVVSSLVSLVLNIILNYILIKTMGVYGLALATSLVSLVNGLLIYIYIQQISKVKHV